MQPSRAIGSLKRPTAVPVQILIQNGVPANRYTSNESLFSSRATVPRQGFVNFKPTRARENSAATENIRSSQAGFCPNQSNTLAEQIHNLAQQLPEPSLLHYLIQLQHQAQVYQQTGQALAGFLPRNNAASMINVPPTFQQVTDGQAPRQQIAEQHAMGVNGPESEASSQNSQIPQPTIFENCSPGSLVGSLKRYVPSNEGAGKDAPSNCSNGFDDKSEMRNCSLMGGAEMATTTADLCDNDDKSFQSPPEHNLSVAADQEAHQGLRKTVKARRDKKRGRPHGLRTPRYGHKRASQTFASEEASSPAKTNEDRVGLSNLQSTAVLSTPPQKRSEILEHLQPVAALEPHLQEEAEPEGKLAGGQKRKRKTEKQLACLQAELRGSNLLWSRQKIIEISERTGMSETQIYKWWWDQTRKRMKKLKNCGLGQVLAPEQSHKDRKMRVGHEEASSQNGPEVLEIDRLQINQLIDEKRGQISDLTSISFPQNQGVAHQAQCAGAVGKAEMLSLKRQRTSELLAASQGFFVPAIDEFGGYSSRLRIPEMSTSKQDDKAANTGLQQKKQSRQTGRQEPKNSHEDGGCGASLSLCHLLNIDVEKLALQIVEDDLAGKTTATTTK